MTSSKLGTDIKTGQIVEIFKLSRLLGLYVIGLQGMGKSGLYEELIIQDMKQGIGLCVLDPHGELIEHVIARIPDRKTEEKVILLDITDKNYSFGLNLFECSDPTDDMVVQYALSQVLHVFEKAFGISSLNPLMYDLLYKSAYTLIANLGSTMIDLHLLLTNEACRKKLTQNVSRSDIRDFWNMWDDPRRKSPQDQQKDSYTILNKLNDFLGAPLRYIVGQSQSTINLQRIMDEGKVLLVKLNSKRFEQPTKLIGSIIVSLILNAADTRTTNKLFNLYADEFQRFATEDFATLLEEARKSGIGITMAHQNRSQLELSDKQADAELKKRTLNVGNIVVFRIPTDAHELAGQFDTTPLPSEMRLEQVQTPVTDVLGWLSSGRAHPDPKVNYFMKKVFTPMITVMRQHHNFPQGQEAQKAYDYLNHFFYTVMLDAEKMQQELKSGNPSKNALIAQQWMNDPDMDNATFYLMLDPIPMDVFYAMVKHSSFQHEFSDIIHVLQGAVTDIRDVLPQKHEEVMGSAKKALEEFPKIWRNGFEYDFAMNKIDYAMFYYTTSQSSYSQPITNRKEQEASLARFIKELKDFMNGIYKSPIMDASGHYEEKPVPRTFADMQNDIANELVRLPKFTAWVKLTNDKDIVVEHIVTTMKPGMGLYGKALQDRLERIQQQNLKDCYIRERVKIEDEIVKRQSQCSQSLQIQAQQSPPPRRVQIAVCQNCGSQNRQGSKFCSQCGKPI